MKFAVASLLFGSTSGALVAMTPCYDSQMVTDSKAFIAAATSNFAVNMVKSRAACNATTRPLLAADNTTAMKKAIDKSVLQSMAFSYTAVYNAITTPPKSKAANHMRFKEFGEATGVGNIACAIVTDYTDLTCESLKGTLA